MTPDVVSFANLEAHRLKLQARLDALKSQGERNQLGQFSTPPGLAASIVQATMPMLSQTELIRFLDPAFGTGSFYSALLQLVSPNRIERAWGYEIDKHYAADASVLWQTTSLHLNIADFTQQPFPNLPQQQANLLICNPPYVRHHHLSTQDKSCLRGVVKRATGLRLSGLSGLYCYFILLSHKWMAEDGVACWLIPSEFLDVNYGKQIKQYLLEQVTLLRVHRFDPDKVQFDDALVSSVVVWLRKRVPPVDHTVAFTYGGEIEAPEYEAVISGKQLHEQSKWTSFTRPSLVVYQNKQDRLKLSDLFTIKRGIATGANAFFILSEEKAATMQLPPQFLKPILPSPRVLLLDEVKADAQGVPCLEKRLFLLDCNLPEDEIQAQFPALWRYLQQGIEQKLNERYLCRHRSPWYIQEYRSPPPLLCTYMGRQTSQKNNRPFRFILNHSQAIAANVYLLLYPKPQLQERLNCEPSLLSDLWHTLNRVAAAEMIHHGRTYGGNLHKVEPKELAKITIENFFGYSKDEDPYTQLRLLEKGIPYLTS